MKKLFLKATAQNWVYKNDGSGVSEWIQQQEDNLLYTQVDVRRLFVKTTAQNWVCRLVNGTSPTPTPTPPSGGGTGTGANVVAWVQARLGKFAYSEMGDRLHPDQTGHTDCSGLWYCAYISVANVDVGTWTGAMAQKGTRVAFSDTQTIAQAIALVKAGDLLLLAWSSRNPNYDHVQGFTTDGNSDTLSHGGPGNGPVHVDGSQSMRVAVMWEIRRYV